MSKEKDELLKKYPISKHYTKEQLEKMKKNGKKIWKLLEKGRS